MVYRIYVEKKPSLAKEASDLFREAVTLLGLSSLKGVRILNRYDAEGISPELFEEAIGKVFSEPQVDTVYEDPDLTGLSVFAVEYLPGQFDQRADSASQCIQILSRGERPLVRSAKVYALSGDLSEEEMATFKKYVINPVESREASLEKPETLRTDFPRPPQVQTLDGFRDMDESSLEALRIRLGLAMDEGDLLFCRDYFTKENRDPTLTEIRMIDTYWSDHCRHTTFLTRIDQVSFEDPVLQKTYEDYLETRRQLGRTKPVCLMDLATLGARYLKETGQLRNLDESEEINACTVKTEIEVDGKKEPWLLLFKNETHNHPTEIEPFGGAATCIGGAIRDPLSGRAYVYAAMRVTGASDPRQPVRETLPGKLPQRKIVTTAAAGYSSYGNQVGLATDIVDELYHPGYAAKRMEIGAVIAAAPAENVRREAPLPGDIVILLGGRTGRDGIGGATGSSKAHNAHSVENCGAEVQKGNAPEERKIQRLFRRREACRMIKRCNDFGAGGVSVAIGELADGLYIDLDRVPKKYEGLDGTELAISESQERMAVVVAQEDVPAFLSLADEENLEATAVATVQQEPRLVMTWRGQTVVDISREFLSSNGAEKHIKIETASAEPYTPSVPASFRQGLEDCADDLNCCLKRGLGERFDSTIGAASVLMPYGGKNQKTPIQAMVHRFPVLHGNTEDCSFMSWGFHPYLSEKSPYHGAYLAVVESVSKLIATGADPDRLYLTFQEYFEKPGKDPKRWGKPFSALLGAFRAQKDLKIGAIGGKDSMSGSFEDLDVPPTLVSFAVGLGKVRNTVSPELKKAGHALYRIRPGFLPEDGLPDAKSLLENYRLLHEEIRKGHVYSCCTPGFRGIGEAVLKNAIGNGLGFRFENLSLEEIFWPDYGTFLAEADEGFPLGEKIGQVLDEPVLLFGEERVPLDGIAFRAEHVLEEIFPTRAGENRHDKIPAFSYEGPKPGAPAVRHASPAFLIPVFPGTNCEYDTARAIENAGGTPEVFV
ncbi:MAG: phosphoribosylformylglycinamidine synthase, partial [Clostridia bacterium]|nr:phosphoribosylformylglycinamidine synthase [Clostridia bacterium]